MYNLDAKIIILGSHSVGKSSIIQRLINNKFTPCMESTIGVLFSRYIMKLGDFKLRYEIWDTAGQEKYNSLVPLYYRKAVAAIVVYDLINLNSYNRALRIISDLHQFDKNIIIVLCGNKLDLQEYREISNMIIKSNLDNVDFSIETSAKTNVNILNMFKRLGLAIKEKQKFQQQQDQQDNQNNQNNPDLQYPEDPNINMHSDSSYSSYYPNKCSSCGM